MNTTVINPELQHTNGIFNRFGRQNEISDILTYIRINQSMQNTTNNTLFYQINNRPTYSFLGASLFASIITTILITAMYLNYLHGSAG